MSTPPLRLYDGFDHTSPDLRGTVGSLQARLRAYDDEVVVDGRFDRGTEAAVRSVQHNLGLREDGVVGPVTWQALSAPEVAADGGRFATTYLEDHPLLLEDLEAAARHGAAIDAAAAETGWRPALIVALGSRQSRWGRACRPKGPAGTADWTPRPRGGVGRRGPLPRDGLGFRRGLMGLDHDLDEAARTDDWRDPALNIVHACRRLCRARATLRKDTVLHSGGLVRGTLAAYSCGVGNVLRAVRQGLDLDYYTAGRDFAVDVQNRAGFFQLHGWD